MIKKMIMWLLFSFTGGVLMAQESRDQVYEQAWGCVDKYWGETVGNDVNAVVERYQSGKKELKRMAGKDRALWAILQDYNDYMFINTLGFAAENTIPLAIYKRLPVVDWESENILPFMKKRRTDILVPYITLRELQKGKTYEEAKSGLMFNPSYGGIAKQQDYEWLQAIYSTKNEVLKQYYLPTLMQIFRYNGYTEGLHRLKPLIEGNVSDSEEKQEVLSRYVSYARLKPGQPAPEFRLKDFKGTEHSLSDFKGKVVVIDVWATWCSGCIAKLPYFLAIRDQYKDREDIVFLAISIDQKEAYNKWKFAHPGYKLMDICSLIAHPEMCSFSEDYNITGIPRYFILDREGRIVNVYAPSPGKEFKAMIDDALSEKM